jgi:hypothetical protein
LDWGILKEFSGAGASDDNLVETHRIGHLIDNPLCQRDRHDGKEREE